MLYVMINLTFLTNNKNMVFPICTCQTVITYIVLSTTAMQTILRMNLKINKIVQ